MFDCLVKYLNKYVHFSYEYCCYYTTGNSIFITFHKLDLQNFNSSKPV